MTVPHSYSKKEREYLGRIEARVEILRARLATTNLPDPQEITKELHSLEWVLQQCSRGPVDNPGATHWEDCWRAHHGCAIHKIEQLSPATPQRTKEDV
jgi:hypothetical protein